MTPSEFAYRLPGRADGWRPGSHRARSLGAGQDFVAHARLFDRPDPRRIDLRASVRNLDQDWLVRTYRQRAAIAIHALVDVSASMAFGEPRSKLAVAADFVEALGTSAFRAGDAVGMIAFDGPARDDLYVPPRVGRAAGAMMAANLRRAPSTAAEASAPSFVGLSRAAERLAGRRGLVFIVSDFHGPLDRLGAALDELAEALVVPMVVWDPAEVEPPSQNGLLPMRDLESAATATAWMRPRQRSRWREAVAARRAELARVFGSRRMLPHHVGGRFDAEAMSRYFLELGG